MVVSLGRIFCGAVLLLSVSGTTDRSPPAEQLSVFVKQPDRIVDEPIRYADSSYRLTYRVTAYCDRGTTASGVTAGVGQCAAPSDIPFGSRIYIPALDRTFVVTDRTARRFRKNTVDLYIPAEPECIEFGRQYLECEVTSALHPPRYGSTALVAAVADVAR